MTKETKYRTCPPQKRLPVSAAKACVILLLPVLLAGQSAFAAATCTLNTANRTVTICAPSNGAWVNPTFHVNAGSTDTTAPVTYMKVWVNGALKLTQDRNFIDADLTLPLGKSQRFTVQAHDSAGTLFTKTYYINVTPAVVVAPSSATVSEGKQQAFTANVPVTWSATGGTITSSGLYTAGNGAGSFSVTATATDGSGKTGSAQVTITAPGAVVNFNPTSLNFGPVKDGQSRSMTTTLTNTGSSTLSISGITIVSSTTFVFGQSNTCGSDVVAKGSCTITVSFSPPKREQSWIYSGAVSVSDNAAGSPQQVPLSGDGSLSATSPAARSALASSQTAAVPNTTGPSKVGTRVMDLVDSTRNDPFLADGTKRELLVRFWYPTAATQGCKLAAYTSPAVWNYFSELLKVQLPDVKTNSCLDAPVTESAHPVIIFSHGYTATFTDYTFLFEDLASRGYVVASVDHTYEATAVEFPDGRFATSAFGSHLAENTLRSDEQTLSSAVWTKLDDLKFVVDELSRQNGDASSPFANKLDLSRVAVAGHSLGGLAALLSLNRDARFKAAVLLDADVPDGSASVTETPVLLLTMGREQWSDEECRLWSDLHGPRFAVNFAGGEHMTPSDAVWLAKGAIKTGTMGTEKSVAAVRDYIAAFLDTNLVGKSSSALLTRSSSAYPDATVTAQEQQLCGGP